MSHRFDPTILREYDIRGIVGKTLFAADAHALGPGLRARRSPRLAGSGSRSAMTAG